MESNSKQICRLCLEISDNFVNIFENYQQSTVATILAKHFWFQVNKNDGFSEWLCEICWINTKTFHNFYKRIEYRQANHWNTVGANSAIKQERSDSPAAAALEPELNIVQYEETKPSAQIMDLLLSTEEGSDNKDMKLFDQINYDSSDNRDHPSNEIPQIDDFGDSNVTRDQKLPSDGQRKRSKQNSQNNNTERDKQDAQIREFFNMKCEICSNFEFETLLDARKHYRTVHKKSGYLVCCDKKLDRRCMLLEHIRNHTNPDAYRCDACGKSFLQKSSLKAHIKTHAPLDSRPHKCTLCPSSFSIPSALKFHVQNKHGSGDTLPCDKCNKHFRTKLLLSAHVRMVHEFTLEHICEICARRFKTKQMLKNHTECEHATTPRPKAQCDICGAWLAHKLSLQKHMKLHDDTNFEAQTCPICKKTVQNKRYLSSHIRYAHTGRRYRCTLCGKEFKRAKNLKEHTASIHTGEDLYDCSYCEKKFKSNGNKYSHVKKVHFAEWTRDCDKRKLLENKSPD